jgi:hypothetical protein
MEVVVLEAEDSQEGVAGAVVEVVAEDVEGLESKRSTLGRI